ncbi:MAG: hypothetical protein R3F55_01730 [Alphaproteobacteria bacterium]
MYSLERSKAFDSFEDAILDQDFDDWQADLAIDDIDLDSDFADLDEGGFDTIARDSHFRLSELDFSAERGAR